MLCTIPTATMLGVDGHPAAVNVHISRGLPGYTIVGVPDGLGRESRDRIRAAILSSGFTWPQHRITILVGPRRPGPRGGAGLDLPIALGILGASRQLAVSNIGGYGAIGELGLDGTIRPVVGIAGLTEAVDADTIITCRDSAAIGQIMCPHKITAADTLTDAVDAINEQRGPADPNPIKALNAAQPAGYLAAAGANRRGIEVAAAGGHHLLIVGPAGSGKTKLAGAVGDLLPDLTTAQREAVVRAHSAASLPITRQSVTRPPVRRPSPDSSSVAIVGGGGRAMRPGEIAVAHTGVILLDDINEYPSTALAALRQPMEDRCINVARHWHNVEYPAAVLVVATLSPCPCGHLDGSCSCSAAALDRHQRRFTGTLRDRFSIRIETTNTSQSERGERLSTIAARVAAAREHAQQRKVTANAHLSDDDLHSAATLTSHAKTLLDSHTEVGELSNRGRRDIHAVALTITDLDNPGGDITADAVAEAINLRLGQTRAQAAA